VTPSAAEPLEIRYREAWGYGVVVPVRIQGFGPFDFLLDTGTDVTVVRDDVARRLGLTPTARVEVATVAGQRLVRQASVETVELGGRALGPIDVLIHDMRAARAADPRLAGILGQNALRQVTLTIDHARRRVVIGGPPLEGAAYMQIEGRAVIEARLRCAGEPLRLTLDSGIGGIVLFERAIRLPVQLTGWTVAKTNLGRATLRSGRLESLCVGAARLEDIPVAVQTPAPGSAPPDDGLLPTRVFARVQFDGPRREVRLEPW
jgi:predicted aspartyl protease